MITILPTKPSPREVAEQAILDASRDPIARARRARQGLDIPEVPAELTDATRARLLGVAIARSTIGA